MKYTLFFLLFGFICTVESASLLNEDQAHAEFAANFSSLFNTSFIRPDTSEAVFVDFVSQRIWNSKNVQSLAEGDRYKEYERLMGEFYSGSHMLFEEAPNESILTMLQNKLGPEIRSSFSSHYGGPGAEVQYRLSGQQIPEILFNEGEFEVSAQGTIIPGSYATKDLPKERRIKMFWVQTERTADGPDWESWIGHKIDFIQYFFLKSILHCERPQIARYVGPYGRGLSDKNPVVILLKMS